MTEQLEQDVGQLKTDVGVLKTEVSGLKQSERDAKNERKAIHDKLDDILRTINQRIGGDRVKTGIRYTLTAIAGTVLGWILKVFTGGS